MWGFFTSLEEKPMNCVIGKVGKQLVACTKGYLVRLFAGDEKGFDCVIASCLGPYFILFEKLK